MSDLGGSYPIRIQAEETKAMKLKWIAARKQESRSKLVHLKQAIEDLIQGKIPEIERQILAVEQEAQQLEAQEANLKNSIDAESV
jgi:type IV secretory pathway VirD2 relaxase